MTEAEAIESLAIMASNTATYFTVFLSFTFGYLSVAYFLGAALTNFQCLAISGIYFFSASVFGAAAIGWTGAYDDLKNREQTILDDYWILNIAEWASGVLVMVVSIILVSLYFMYDVRKRATAQTTM
jgi:hypothetical protein